MNQDELAEIGRDMGPRKKGVWLTFQRLASGAELVAIASLLVVA